MKQVEAFRNFAAYLVLAVAGIVAGVATFAHAKPRGAIAMSPRIVVPGNVSSTGSVTPQSIQFVQDGTYSIIVDVALNGGHRTRVVSVSADGTAIAFDGVPVASPPAAATNLAAELVTIGGKITTMFSNAAVQAAMTAP